MYLVFVIIFTMAPAFKVDKSAIQKGVCKNPNARISIAPIANKWLTFFIN